MKKLLLCFSFLYAVIANAQTPFDSFDSTMTNVHMNEVDAGYRYGFNGQEKSEEIGTGHYTAKFWEYSSPTARRWNLDPKPTVGISDYSVFFNNPILNVDIFGDKPTPREAQRIAALVNGDLKTKLIGNWKLSNLGKGLKLNDPETGLKSATFERTLNGKTEYAYAIAGTNPTSVKDWMADLGQAAFGNSNQYNESVSFSRKLSDQLPDNEMTFIGYSKGGGQAAAGALATGRNAVTFNAAGLSRATKNLLLLHESAQIENYRVGGEILGPLQGLIGIKAEGTTHTVGSLTKVGTFVPIIGIVESVQKHLMGSVGTAFDK